MNVNGRIFKNLPTFVFGTSDLHEIVAMNDQYVLTQHNENGYYFYVWTNTFKIVEKRMDLDPNQKRFMKKRVEPYFGTCQKLMNKMYSNIDAKKMFTEDISNYHCGEE